MDNSKFLSERNKLVGRLNEADKAFRLAVRWLMEANGFGNTFRSDDTSWKGYPWTELADAARSTREEAIEDLLNKRSELDAIKAELKEFDKRAKEEA